MRSSLLGLAAERKKPSVARKGPERSEEHTSELQSRPHLVCRLLLEKKKLVHESFDVRFRSQVERCRPRHRGRPPASAFPFSRQGDGGRAIYAFRSLSSCCL